MAEGASGPEANTFLLRLLMTHFDGVDTRRRATRSCVLLDCETARFLLISVGSFAYMCRPLRGVNVFCLWERM